ncbi:MAG: tetratricopeptide (TPR) repeat protein [Verrucomicrobiales bacterium]|jgi:tetratricopeptide (TPR) repeat protein
MKFSRWSFLFLLLSGSAFGETEISTDFPGGNVIVLENDGTKVRLKPDLRGGRDWFYWNFEAAAADPGTVEFVFEGKLRIGVRGPAVSVDGGKNWKWLGTESVRYSSTDEPSESFKFEFTDAVRKARFAVAIPYLQQELDAFLDEHRSNPNLAISQLTETKGGKPVELLKIGESGADKEAVIVTARHHACESMASYVLEGFLAEAMADSPAGRAFRDRYVLYAVPMMDKDGVEAGDQGKWRFPHDHNRDYGRKSIYPEVQELMKLAKKVNVRIALDFHCPSLRGETHEVFYFIGVGLPHIRANTDELRGWIGEEQPQSIRTAPHNFLRDPPKEVPEVLEDTMFSLWFSYLEGVRFAATFEIPYTQRNLEIDAAMARDYGHSTLRAWERADFLESKSHAELAEFRRDFSGSYKSKPDEAESRATSLISDENVSDVLKIEAVNSIGLLRLRQRRFDEALEQFDQVSASTAATASQRETAVRQRVVAISKNPESTAQQVEEAIRLFEKIAYPSSSAQFEAYGATATFFDSKPSRALEFTLQQLLAAGKYQRGETLNRIAGYYDKLGQPENALEARRQAVAHLRGQLDPVPVGIFGPLMARDLFEALQQIPDATVDEKRAAAEMVLNHKVTPKSIREAIQAALADLK